MLGINIVDLAIIAFVAIVMFGPDRVPELARGAARLMKNLRMLAAKTQDDLRQELGPEFSDFRLSDLDPRQAIRRHVLDGLDPQDLDLTAALKPAAAPPVPSADPSAAAGGAATSDASPKGA